MKCSLLILVVVLLCFSSCGEDPGSLLTSNGSVSVYRFETTKAINSFRVLVDGAEHESGSFSVPSVPSKHLELAIVEQDTFVEFNIQIGGGSTPVRVARDTRGRRIGHLRIPNKKRLEVNGPTSIYRLERKEPGTGTVLKTVEVLVGEDLAVPIE